MTITLKNDNYTLIADLTVDNDPGLMPDLGDVVDCALYLLTFYYDGLKIMEVAHKWTV